jgi:hypothetical protein
VNVIDLLQSLIFGLVVLPEYQRSKRLLNVQLNVGPRSLLFHAIRPADSRQGWISNLKQPFRITVRPVIDLKVRSQKFSKMIGKV